MRVSVIFGPNLNLLGKRQPEIYGSMTLEELESQITAWANKLGVETWFFQSNDEGALTDAIHEAGDGHGVILNPGAYTHTSRAMADAVSSIPAPVVEVHLSDIKSREAWRASSVLEGVAARTIFGRGPAGYRDALRLLVNLQTPARVVRYGPHAENVGDLRIPPAASGLILLIHGGLWLREWARDGIDTLATDLHRRGYATWNIEYRRKGAGGAWPGSGHDIQQAFDFIPQIADVSNLPTGVVGHSAGGYLALWLATRRHFRVSVGLAPITDLEALASHEGPGRRPAIHILDQGAPSRLTPTGNILLIHGKEDEIVPFTQSQRPDPARGELFDDLGHFELLDPTRPHWPTVLGALAESLAQP